MSNTLPIALTRLSEHISIVFFSFEYFDPYDHYAACWVTLHFSQDSGPEGHFDSNFKGCLKYNKENSFPIFHHHINLCRCLDVSLNNNSQLEMFMC